MAFPSSEKLLEILKPVADRLGVVAERVETRPAGAKSTVVLVVDSDNDLGLDELEPVSQAASEALDEAEEGGVVSLGAGYTLEVTTPGVDEPLTKPRHWRRNRGRLVAFDADPFAPEGADAEAQQAEAKGKKKGGKKKPGAKGYRWRIGALGEAGERVALVRATKAGVEARALRLLGAPRAVVQIEFSAPPKGELAATERSFADIVNDSEE